MNNSLAPLAKLLAWLRLLRAPNVFTALADIGLGWLYVTSAFTPSQVWAVLALASACLYLAGMVLNDVYDYALDCRERPTRPLPAGQISLAVARRVGYCLLAAGWVAGAMAPALAAPHAALAWRSGAVASILAAGVVLYDAAAKKSPLAGPLVMGACRFLNVLLGMSLAANLPLPGATAVVAGFAAPHLLVAGGMGLYVAGITVFARREAEASSRSQLALGLAIMLAGLAVATMSRAFADELHGISLSRHAPSFTRFASLMGVLGMFVAWRCVRAIVQPNALLVQAAVKSSLLSIIVLDAALCASVRGPMIAALLLLLLVPSILLAQWVYST